MGKPALRRSDVGRREWVDFVKGVAIILIVAYHTALFLTSVGIDAAGIGRVKVVLELFPMAAFFVITGTFHARVGSWSFADLWRRRLRQYLYLYVLWSVIRFVFYLLAPNVRSDGAGGAATDPLALLGILLWPISSYWFIYALFVFTAVLWLFRAAPPWVLITVSAVLSVLSSSGILDAGNVGINRMSEYLVFFVVGAYANRRIYAWADALTPLKAAGPVAGFIVFAAAVTVLPFLQRVPGIVLLGQVLAVAAGYALAVFLVRLTFLRWLVYIGVRTLNIYLVHIFVIALLVAPLALVPWVDDLPGRGLLLTLAITAVVVALSIVITRYLTRVSWLFVYPFRHRRGSAVRGGDAAREQGSER